MGRAVETAQFTAKHLDLPVIPCDFIREIVWAPLEGKTIEANGHLWELSKILSSQGVSLAAPNWMKKEPWCDSRIIEDANRVTRGLDELLSELGYQREGEYYRVTSNKTDTTIAIFSHAGASTVAMSHLLNIPLPQLCALLPLDYTSITTFRLSNGKGRLIYPKITTINDAKHIKDILTDNVYGN